MAFATFEFTRFALRHPIMHFMKWREWKTIAYELPTFMECKEIVERVYPSPKAPEILNYMRDPLYYRGQPIWVIDEVFEASIPIYDSAMTMLDLLVERKERVVPEEKVRPLVEQGYVVPVKDRFGIGRLFPATRLFEIPTASELCRMMVRDMFWGPEEFTKAVFMRGYIMDLAMLYYLLHFKYPSPEKLWAFLCRGVSGLLWLVPTEQMRKASEVEAKMVGAYKPVMPTELNFKHEVLFGAFNRYMKWHDYAIISWIGGYTTDSWIVLDTLADIPTKIDIRWMTKWGLFDHMIKKDILLETPTHEFIKVVEDRSANPKVEMNLVLMCRLLQATGLHPYYIPIVSVAESIMALSDERTLLRTGAIHLYERGMIAPDVLDKLLAELTIASFKVAYFDIKELKWKEGFINVPVMYLPAERKLLMLRALIDKYERVFKDTLSNTETSKPRLGRWRSSG